MDAEAEAAAEAAMEAREAELAARRQAEEAAERAEHERVQGLLKAQREKLVSKLEQWKEQEARDLMTQFSFGHEFLRLNRDALDAYAAGELRVVVNVAVQVSAC